MSSETDNKALLAQLRIDRSAPIADESPSRRPWIIARRRSRLLVAAAGAWWLTRGPAALAVHTQLARAVTAGGAQWLGSGCDRLRHRTPRGHRVGADHRHADRRC